jgi:hypothetical protein
MLLGYPFVRETPFRCDEAFAEVVDRWQAVGFDELVFYYPAEWAAPEGAVASGLFERVLAKG